MTLQHVAVQGIHHAQHRGSNETHIGPAKNLEGNRNDERSLPLSFSVDFLWSPLEVYINAKYLQQSSANSRDRDGGFRGLYR